MEDFDVKLDEDAVEECLNKDDKKKKKDDEKKD